MIEVKRIFPECNADTLLVELLLQRGAPAHYKGISKVAKALQAVENNEILTYGIVDSDKFKNNPPYFEQFKLIEDKSVDQGLILKQLPNSNKHLIFICPEFEPWIWQRAADCGINPNDSNFGFVSLDVLNKVSKKNEIHEQKEFKKFVNAVVQKNPPAIVTLRNWLSKVLP